MTPEAARSAYRRLIDQVGEEILVRRYTGAGANRPRFDVPVMARVSDYGPAELIGEVKQGDRRVVVLVEDLIRAQFKMPIRVTDNAVVRGREMAIQAVDDSTRRVGATLVAYELRVRG